MVIPARSGSKGIKNKNIRMVHGIPMLAHSILYAQNSKIDLDVFVSTDSKAYAKIAADYNCEPPLLRPIELSLDHVRDFPVLKHALLAYEELYNKIYDYVVLLRPTSPVRTPGLIELSLTLLNNDTNADSVRSVIKVEQHAYRQWTHDGKYIRGLFPELEETYNWPRQELPPLYFQSGDLEVMRRSTIVNKNSVSGQNVIPLELNDYLDIDHEEDLLKLNDA